MDPKIRRATRDDVGFLAWVMLASSRSHVSHGIWDLIVGASDSGCLDYLRRLTASAWPKPADIQPPRCACLSLEKTGGRWF